MAAYLTEILYP